MSEKITCPNCGTKIDIDAVLSHQAEEKYKKAFQEKELALLAEKKSFEEKKAKENELFQERLQKQVLEESKKIELKTQQELEEKYSLQNKELATELEQRKQENQQLKQKELAFLKKEEQLKEKEQEIELNIQRQLNEERKALEEKIAKQVEETTLLQIKQKDEQIEQIKKQLIDAQRKANQGSMQIQGEAQEHFIEDYLKEHFPLDNIEEVGKGKRGADCIQIINTYAKKNCGSIIYESKQTVNWSNDWIEKLKADARQAKADIAVLVTTAFPKDIDRMTLKDGIWVCTLEEFKGLCLVLRESIIKISDAAVAQQNKGDKMHLLYDYLTSNEFSENWKAIHEGFMDLKIGIQKERDAMERLWKAREKQLEKVLINSNAIQGSIQGIAGLDYINLNLLDE
ncbi:MAG: DUF2130 domain-containing protein [Chitinophagales bacterium]|nr:DUF2130 domain-containing protein [Chitinophagales bacterium]